MATTYSMDFETAVTIPAAMAFHAAENRDQLLDAPIMLLNGLKRLAGKIAIFCEAGRISARSSKESRLIFLLENTVTEVLAPQGGAFHPKLWVLRFMPVDGDGPGRLRLIILSRNLTTDRSWDLSLTLDGTIGENVQLGNAPLSALLRALPGMARGESTPARNRCIADALADDLDVVVWDKKNFPAGAKSVKFAVNGIGDKPFQPEVGDALGIISPFLSSEVLLDLTEELDSRDCWLISRDEELALTSSDARARFGQVKILNDSAEAEDGEDVDVGTVLGLHAKVFVTEHCRQKKSSASLTVGSGNATTAALKGRNVEVFATLSGPTRLMGRISDHISQEHLGKFLQAWEGRAAPSEQTTADESRLEKIHKKLSSAEMVLCCKRQKSGRIALTLCANFRIDFPKTIKIDVWPLTVGPECAINLKTPLDSTGVMLGEFELADVTRWIGVSLTNLTAGDHPMTFTLGTTLKGLQEKQRTAEIFSKIINNHETFLRYVHLLIGDAEEAVQMVMRSSGKRGLTGSSSYFDDTAILENMVHLLSGHVHRLHDVEDLMERLKDAQGTDGKPIIPSSFADLWEVFRRVLERDSPHG